MATEPFDFDDSQLVWLLAIDLKTLLARRGRFSWVVFRHLAPDHRVHVYAVEGC